MTETERCTECGAELQANAPRGICPKCLLRAGLGSVQVAANLHVRCPHCHNPIELVDDSSFREIDCPSCGSRFNLAANASTIAFQQEGDSSIGHFQLIEKLGIGHFGTVWKAKDTELDRTVAIKVPRKDQLDEAEREQFLREARAAAQLRHPNIVTVHEVGREDGTIYIASDYVEGADLQEWLTGQRLTPRETAELCRKVAEALHHAHEQGVVHRDLKPGNIMLDLDGEPHIMDFGLAKRDTGEITMTMDGKILGTPAYMSPEQARGEGHQADRRADVYSLGVILYELLTGELPFRGDKRMLIVQILRDEPTAPRRIDGGVPRDLETICLKCLEKDPARRYQTGSELADDVRRYLAGEPIQARPVSTTERLWRWCRRNPAVASLTSTVAILLLVGATVATYAAFEFRSLAEKERLAAKNERDARSKADAASNLADAARKEAETERDRAHAAREQSLKEKERAEQAERETSDYLYAARMSLAQKAWEATNIGQMVDVLNLYRPGANGVDRRGFEWYYLWRLCHQELRTLDHKSPVASIAVSPNGRILASASVKSFTSRPGSSGEMRVWDAATGELISTIKGSQRTTAFSPDGSTLASADLRTVKLWDAATGELKSTLSGHTNLVFSVAFSPDGNTLASGGGDDTVKLWDIATSQSRFTLRGHTALVHSVTFSPDGNTLASGSHDDTVKLWDVNTGNERASLTGHAGYVTSVSFSPDGHTLASASGDRSIKLWDVDTGSEVATSTGHDWAVNCVAFSPDGTAIASASHRTVKIWSVPTLEPKATINGHADEVSSVVFFRDGRMLASASRDGTIKFWDVASQERSGYLDGMTAAFSPDSNTLATGGTDGLIMLWDVSTSKLKSSIKGFSGGVFLWSFSPNGKILATVGVKSPRSPPAEMELKLWDVSTGKQLDILRQHMGGVQTVAFSPDGRTLVTGSYERRDQVTFDNVVKLWDISTGELRTTLRTQSEGLTSIDFSPDGRMLASAGGNSSIGELMLWNLVTRDEPTTLRGNTIQVTCVSFSPDGKILASGSMDQTIKMWDVRTGQLLATLREHSGPVLSVAFSPDGKTLASASFDKTVILWDAATGQRRITLTGHTDLVVSVVFSPDGKTMASGSRDNTVKLWRAATEKEVLATPADATGLDRVPLPRVSN